MLTHTSRYMEHEGGTKFYEVVELNSHDRSIHFVIRRWGKLDQAYRGAGQVKIEEFTNVRESNNAAARILDDKERRGYSSKRSTFGIHNLSGVYKEVGLVNAIKNHYADSDVYDRVVTKLNNFGGRTYDAIIIDEIVCEEPVPEPERGDEWGSW